MGQTNPELPVQSGVVDTHCHLFLMDQEPAVAVETARAAGVERLLCVGVDLATSRRSLELAESLPGVFATAGVHPHDAATFDQATAARIEELLHDPRVVGVGECGLDFFRMHSPVDAQIEALRVHIAWSNESGKTAVVHVRDAWPETLKVLEEGSASRVTIHCFSGDTEIANECAARGYWMSFAGNITYPKNEHLRQAARSVPPELLLIETDAPYLAPQILRGRDNAPQNVLFTLEELARIREEPASTLAKITAENASRAFPGLDPGARE
jgi:TatD DNase family protein